MCNRFNAFLPFFLPNFLVQQYVGFVQKALKENNVYTEDGKVDREQPFFREPPPNPIAKGELGRGACCSSANSIQPRSANMRALYDLHSDYVDAGLTTSQLMYLAAADEDLQTVLKVAKKRDELLRMLPKDMLPLLKDLQKI
eukprot:tig00020563_g11247.t1